MAISNIDFDNPAVDADIPFEDPITRVPLPPSSSITSNLMIPSMVISAAGSILTSLGQARAAKAQGAYESSIARTNAAIAELQSKQALEAGDMEASRENTKTRQVTGSIRASQGASGTDVNSGSNALTRLGVEEVGAMDELTIRNNAARQAWGYKTEAIQDTYKGQFADLTARSQAHQSILTGGLKSVEGPAGIYANYLRFSRWMQGGGGTSVPFPDMRT